MRKVSFLVLVFLLMACALLPAGVRRQATASPAWALKSANTSAPDLSEPSTPPASGVPGLTYVAGSTVKLEQLLGEQDKQLHQPTLSQTFTRYGIQGTDLGSSFENNGLVDFLFGDTVGKLGGALDTIAQTNATQPEQGVRLDFLTVGKDYLTIRPAGISMGAFETPIGGIAIGSRMYVAVRTNHAADWSTDRSVLTRFTLPATFDVLRTMSQSPAGRFLTMSFHAETASVPGLPSGGPFIFIWGTATYRKSDAYLSIVPAANFESGQGTQYFSGLESGGLPKWSAQEADAQPVLRNGTMGDLSITWSKDLNLWLMTYDSRPPAPQGIEFSYSSTPWGPWSEPQVIFNAIRDGAQGTFIHDPAIKPDDGLAGPVIGAGTSNPDAVRGGTYAPYVVERWTKVQGSELDLYYTLSTWNPYVVMLMKTRFLIH
jgi:hypothetical protein